jgi:Cft2 family RNA processing exonuclease
MQIEFLETGIFLPELDLWLDPAAPCATAWLSHAHSDHARGVHGCVLATAETAECYEMRWPDPAGDRRIRRVPFGEPFDFREARLTAFPAGHILGAAQLRIEFGGETVVYTGDMKLRPPIAGATAELVACDRLILESTFGLPIYYFLSRDEARERIVEFARATLDDGATPVFLGYALGRGQEIAHVLSQAGIPVGVHGAIAKFLPVYERAGFGFEGWRPYEAGRIEGQALVVTPGMRTVFEASRHDCRIAYVSGWAALANARARTGAQELIPYSDHAGFDELMEIVETSGARRVDLVHGYAEPFAKILRDRGVDAHAARAAAREAEDA